VSFLPASLWIWKHLKESRHHKTWSTHVTYISQMVSSHDVLQPTVCVDFCPIYVTHPVYLIFCLLITLMLDKDYKLWRSPV
jgi:hypothetical protein